LLAVVGEETGVAVTGTGVALAGTDGVAAGLVAVGVAGTVVTTVKIVEVGALVVVAVGNWAITLGWLVGNTSSLALKLGTITKSITAPNTNAPKIPSPIKISRLVMLFFSFLYFNTCPELSSSENLVFLSHK
jgi:hypothetical protein